MQKLNFKGKYIIEFDMNEGGVPDDVTIEKVEELLKELPEDIRNAVVGDIIMSESTCTVTTEFAEVELTKID